MAETGHPVSELFPLGETVLLEPTLSGQSLFDNSRSSTQATPLRLTGGQGHTCQVEAVNEICAEHSVSLPTSKTDCSGLGVCKESCEQQESPTEDCVLPGAPSHLPSQAETHTPTHQHKIAGNATSDPKAARNVQSTFPTSLPVHRSHSDTLPLVKQGVCPQAADSETCELAYHGRDQSIQEAETHCVSACKQPVQLQQCNIVTTVCRGASSEGGGVQQSQGRCVCISSAKATVKVEYPEEEGHLPPKCDKTLCYGSYIHHPNFEDTFAAYCHPQPIPAPSQLLPRLAGIEPTCNIQCAVAPSPAANHLTLPRLISSVSETGLDAKHLLRCCNLSCSWISSLPPGIGPQSQKHLSRDECCSSPVGQVRTMTHDIGTMTAPKVLRDVGVQTAQTISSHVFPQICLADESKSKTSCSQTPNNNSDRGKESAGAPKSPVKEVKWDAEGMTWEVYGASVDPEELGLAIQKHLELQIKETANRAAKLSRQNTNTSRHSKNMSFLRKRSRMMGSIRTPSCCSRSTTAVD